MENKECSVVILNWNGARMMRKFLPSVVKYSQATADVVVADNGSTDDSLEMLKADFPSARIIELEKNYGFAEGYNRAIQQISTPYTVLLNSDVEATPGWLEPLLDFMRGDESIAAVQPKLLAYDDKSSFEYAGAAGGFVDRFGYPFCRGRIFDCVEKDDGQYSAPMEIHWATGACMVVRTDDYKEAGGLDGRFFAHNEEIDLCWRLRLRGKKIFCVPSSTVYHVGGGTLPQGNPKKTYLNFRNNLTMIYKNMASPQMEKTLRMRFWLDRIAALQSILKNRNMKDYHAIMCARRDFKDWRKDYESIRAGLQQERTLAAEKETAQYSILWQFFAKKRRKFSEIV